MGLSIGNLGGLGLDTNSLVTQLMQSESIPQQQLQAKQQTVVSQQNAWAKLTTTMTGFAGSLSSLLTPDKIRASSATSSDTSRLSVTADGSAAAGSVTLQIASLATTDQWSSAGVASTGTALSAGTLLIAGGADKVGISALTASGIGDGHHTLAVTTGASSGGTASVSIDGTAYDVAVGSGPVTVGGLTFNPGSSLTAGTVDIGVATSDGTTTLAGLASTLTSNGGPAAAAAVDLGSGTDPARLVLSATSTGTAHALTITGTGGLSGLASGMTVNRAATDAVIKMGSLTVTRSTNTVTDLLPGITLNLLKADPAGTSTDINVGVDRDTATMTKSVQSMVDGINNLINTMSDASKLDPSNSGNGGPLAGDSGVRSFLDSLRGTIGNVVGSDGSTLSALGIALQRDGTYSVNSDTLSAALEKDPDAVSKLVSQAATALNAVATQATSGGGFITNAKSTADSQYKDLGSQIDDWTMRLDIIQQRYSAQFTALNVAVSSMKDQQSWLTSQLGSLSSG